MAKVLQMAVGKASKMTPFDGKSAPNGGREGLETPSKYRATDGQPTKKSKSQTGSRVEPLVCRTRLFPASSPNSKVSVHADAPCDF